ncbi:laccase domain-containing protein [Candidatus Williamhamiltonella defendens]|uniref:laccase domain-containing protein n=1 Tax=Candidatus Williamhamiltonella defendens TaxID=138072 RepID=UPI00387E5ABA
MLLIPDWPTYVNVRSYSTTCQGGVRLPPYHFFNLSTHVGDNRDHVEKSARNCCVARGRSISHTYLVKSGTRSYSFKSRGKIITSGSQDKRRLYASTRSSVLS